MNQSEFRVINLLKAREKWRVQCAIKRNNREIIFAKNGELNLVLALVLEPQGPSYKLVCAILLVFEKITRAYLFQIALKIMWLPIQT